MHAATAVLCAIAAAAGEQQQVSVNADGSLNQFRGTEEMTTGRRLAEAKRVSLAEPEDADAAEGAEGAADANADTDAADKDGADKDGADKEGADKADADKEGADKADADKEGADKEGADKEGAEAEPKKPEAPPPVGNGDLDEAIDGLDDRAKEHPGAPDRKTPKSDEPRPDEPAGKEEAKESTGGPPPDAFKQVETRFDKYITTHNCFVLLCVTLVLAILFEYFTTGMIRPEYEKVGEPRTTEEIGVGSWADYRNFNLILEYFLVSTVGRTRGLPLAAYSLLIGAMGIYFAYAVNSLISNYWDGLQEQDWPKFFTAIMTFVAISVCSVVGNAYREYIDRIVNIQARQWIQEKYTRLWLEDSAHFQPVSTDSDGSGGLIGKQLDNPDQRICQDSRKYISMTLSMTQDFVTNMAMLCVFLPILWKASPPSGPFGFVDYAVAGWLCHAALAYAALGTLTVHFLASKVSTYAYAKERAEADLRFGLVTIRDHSEGVAMLAPDSEEAEKGILQTLYNAMRGLQWRLNFLEKRLNIFQSLYWDISDIGPIFILAPAFFSGELTMGSMLACRHALGQVIGSFAWFVGAYFELGQWGACCHRLREVDTFAESRKNQLAGRQQQGAGLEVDQLTLHTPLGEALIERASFQVPRGQWALLSGPEGSGKTTLLRALRGVGPPPAGGTVGLEKAKAMFIPAARNSSLRDGSLFRATAYPVRDDDEIPDQKVADALHAVGLGELLERPGDELFVEESRNADEPAQEQKGLGAHADWGRLLSAGELQRIMLAKAILAEPDVLVLDEPVAHCAEGEATHALFKKLKAALPKHTTVLTVTHQGKEVLREFHDLELSLDPKQKTIHCQPVV